MKVCPVCGPTTIAGTGQEWHSVAIASGIVSEQAECSVTEAADLMRRRADAIDRTLEQLADAVIASQMRFGPQREST